VSRGRWEICSCCQGEGTVDVLGVVSPDDFAGGDGDDTWELYKAGAYDAPCAPCLGSGKVLAGSPAPVVRFGRDGQKVVYEDADDASEHSLRMAEGWC
jgi:hypothetical protein